MNDPTPVLVSVCIPTYNSAAFVAETIESVLAQDHPSFELVIADHGSTDETAEVVRGTRTTPGSASSSASRAAAPRRTGTGSPTSRGASTSSWSAPTTRCTPAACPGRRPSSTRTPTSSWSRASATSSTRRAGSSCVAAAWEVCRARSRVRGGAATGADGHQHLRGAELGAHARERGPGGGAVVGRAALPHRRGHVRPGARSAATSTRIPDLPGDLPAQHDVVEPRAGAAAGRARTGRSTGSSQPGLPRCRQRRPTSCWVTSGSRATRGRGGCSTWCCAGGCRCRSPVRAALRAIGGPTSASGTVAACRARRRSRHR